MMTRATTSKMENKLRLGPNGNVSSAKKYKSKLSAKEKCEQLKATELDKHYTDTQDERGEIVREMEMKVDAGKMSCEEFRDRMVEFESELTDLYELIESIKESSRDQEQTIKKQNIAIKDNRNETLIELKQVQEKFETIEKENKDHIRETINNKNKAHNNQQDIIGMKKVIEQHALKLNATNSYKGGAWKLHSDEDMYPMLKQDRNCHWSKYNANVKDIKLEGDTLIQLQKFWHANDTAITSTLSANKCLGNYEDLTEYYLAKNVLVPPTGHTQRKDGMNAYNNYSRVLRDHLIKEGTIDKENCPIAYKCLIKNQLNKDGFEILTKIIINGSPQLGGDERDLTEYVNTLEICDGDEIVEYYFRAQEMYQEIKLQQDQSGQEQRLTKRFLEQLQRVPEYKAALGDISKQSRRFFKKRSWSTEAVPHTIEEIYEELEAAEVETTVTILKLTKPKVNAGSRT